MLDKPQIVLVDEIKGASRNACMELKTLANGTTGEIESGILYVKRSTFNNATQTQLAELLQHELGHFIGLKDFYGNADQCQTTMAQAQDGCAGLKGSKAISADDVASVNKYVNHSTDCKGKRTRTSVVGGGYTDPNPIPNYYPYTCYYYYGAYDVYYECDCRENGQYAYNVVQSHSGIVGDAVRKYQGRSVKAFLQELRQVTNKPLRT